MLLARQEISGGGSSLATVTLSPRTGLATRIIGVRGYYTNTNLPTVQPKITITNLATGSAGTTTTVFLQPEDCVVVSGGVQRARAFVLPINGKHRLTVGSGLLSTITYDCGRTAIQNIRGVEVRYEYG